MHATTKHLRSSSAGAAVLTMFQSEAHMLFSRETARKGYRNYPVLRAMHTRACMHYATRAPATTSIHGPSRSCLPFRLLRRG